MIPEDTFLSYSFDNPAPVRSRWNGSGSRFTLSLPAGKYAGNSAVVDERLNFNPFAVMVAVKESKSGKGVYADEFIRKGTMVLDPDLSIYDEIRSEEEFESYIVTHQYDASNVVDIFHWGGYDKDEDCITVGIDISRYINHSSYDYNVARIWRGYERFYALNDIKKGDELLFHYGLTNVEDEREHSDWFLRIKRKYAPDLWVAPKMTLSQYKKLFAANISISVARLLNRISPSSR